MKIIAKRLTRGMDLKLEIEKIMEQEHIVAGVILSSVGSLTHAKVRLPGGDFRLWEEGFEIVALNGTLSRDGLHLHLGLSDYEGKMFGGHLQEGCIINTTCELVIGVMKNSEFTRPFDEVTGYDELMIKEA